jgi:hypothetical protein
MPRARLAESLFLPDIRGRRAVGLHQLYKSVMIVGFPCPSEMSPNPDGRFVRCAFASFTGARAAQEMPDHFRGNGGSFLT